MVCIQAESLHSTAVKILTGSTTFKSENYSLESVASQLKTESNLPDPEISGEYLVLPKDVENRWAAQIEWGVEWPGVYHARANEAREKLTAAELSLYAQRLARLAEIKDLLLDYVQCRIKMLLLDELIANNDTIYRLATEAARGGEMTVLDLNKVRLEYANIRAAQAALIDEEATVKADISRIYGGDSSPLLENMDYEFPPIVLPTEEELARIKDESPEVKAAIAEAEAARRGKNVAKMEALPSISLGYKHAYEDNMHFNGAVFGISIPIFSSRGKQKAAKAEIMAAEYQAEAKGLEIEADVMQTWQRLIKLEQQIREIAPILDNADYNSTLLKAYSNGLITLIEYISDRNYFTNAAIELVGLRHAAAKAQAQLRKYIPLTEPF